MKEVGNASDNGRVSRILAIIWPYRVAVCYLTIAACLPYLTLKTLWLFGYSPGATSASGAAELMNPRHFVGNLVTAGMELFAIALVLALTYQWGRRLPVIVVMVPIWIGVGLLAPILLGLPLGLVAQAFVGGSPVPAGGGLGDWVFAVVYGGFILQAVGLLAAFVGYALDRWPEVFWARTTRLRASAPRQRRLVTSAAAIAVVYAVLLAAWSVSGPEWGGPQGFDTVAQRSFLLATGLVVFAGVLATLALIWRWGHGRILFQLALVWIGTGVTVTSGPTHVALSNQGEVSLLLIVASIVAVLSGLLLAGSVIRVLTQSPAIESLA